MPVRYSRAARRHIAAIHYHITKDNEQAAENLVARLVRAIGRLEDFPQLGRPGRVEGTRELSVSGVPYVVVYRVEDEAVVILAVMHTRRNWPS